MLSTPLFLLDQMRQHIRKYFINYKMLYKYKAGVATSE